MNEYELIAGLETHVELSTRTKLFCGCPVAFGGEPNTRCCPVCTGAPGALPTLNREAVRYAALAGLALGCTVHPISQMARKHYTYPDLAKAYQITQAEFPLCTGGSLLLPSGKKIGIERIHIEEDAGKLLHREGSILIDYNRGGVPLIEIVTCPDFRSADEVGEYLEQLQLIMRYLKISDCKMQEGSLRCDVNLSVHKKGEPLGTRTEIKNMNSFSYIKKAMAYEFERQKSLLSQGKPVVQETLRFDEQTGWTHPMRNKEEAGDYRYFPEPDLPPVYLPEDEIDALRQCLPELPSARLERLCREYRLPETDARQLIKYRNVADYFEKAAHGLHNPRQAANSLLGPIFACFANESEKEACRPKCSAAELHKLLILLEERRLSLPMAKSALQTMLETGRSVAETLGNQNLRPLSPEELSTLCRRAVENSPAAVQDYQNGKEKALRAILGAVMRESRGRADAQECERLLKDLLDHKGN